MPESPGYQSSQESPQENSENESPPYKPKKRVQSERPPPYETVPEVPGLSRKLCFHKKFSVYKDAIDASDDVNGKIEHRIPAVYTVLNFAVKGKYAEIGDEAGNPIGWVNTHECSANEWNIPAVFVPLENKERTGAVKLYSNLDSKQPTQTVSMEHTNIFPILESHFHHGETWLRISPDINTINRNEEITEPVWVKHFSQTVDVETGTHQYMVEKKSIQEYCNNSDYLLEQAKLIDQNRLGIKGILRALNINHLKVLGIKDKAVEGSPSMLSLRNSGLVFAGRKITPSDIKRMTEVSYQYWLREAKAASSAVKHVLQSLPVTTLNIDGRSRPVYLIDSKVFFERI